MYQYNVVVFDPHLELNVSFIEIIFSLFETKKLRAIPLNSCEKIQMKKNILLTNTDWDVWACFFANALTIISWNMTTILLVLPARPSISWGNPMASSDEESWILGEKKPRMFTWLMATSTCLISNESLAAPAWTRDLIFYPESNGIRLETNVSTFVHAPMIWLVFKWNYERFNFCWIIYVIFDLSETQSI